MMIIGIMGFLVMGHAEEKVKVGVIGGGLAGLTAAYRLEQKGYDVVLFEAQERLGGRIYTRHLSRNVFELGGENIADGGDAVALKALVRELGLALEEGKRLMQQAYFKGDLLVSDQELYRGQFEREELEERLRVLKATCKNMDEVLAALFPDRGFVYQVFSTKLEGYEGGPPLKLATGYVETLHAMLMGGLSASHALEEKETWIDVIRMKGGNDRLVERLAQALEGRVYLEMPLKGVTKREEGGYHLQFEKEGVDVDLLVFAIPCTTFRDISFGEGTIPNERLKQFDQICYGANEKIMVLYQNKPQTVKQLIYQNAISFFHPDETVMTLYFNGSGGDFDLERMDRVYDAYAPIFQVYGDPGCTALDGYCWVRNPYIRGSYSYIGAGQEKLWKETEMVNGERVLALFAPIAGGIYFAGEHTATAEPLGTMAGACASGEKVAKMIGSFVEK